MPSLSTDDPVVRRTADRRLSPGQAAVAIALLLGLQPVTTDIYLPALPHLAQDLGIGMGGVQLTMSALLLAFGLAQLVWGPVADRVGRRPVLLTGLALYLVASIGSVLAGGIETLVAWRALQGAALAAAVVCARALVRDLYEPHEGARVMALGLSGLAVIAISGPVAGGLVTAAMGWRAALGIVAIFGALTLAYIAWRLPETLATPNPQATHPGPLWRTWRAIATHPIFVAWTALTACSYGGLFVILAGSSFTYIGVLGLSPAAYGLAMASGAALYLLGTLLCRRWIARYGVVGTVVRGAGFTAAAGVSILAAGLLQWHSVWALLLPQWLYLFGHGLLHPCGQAGAVGPFPLAAGAASALSGCVLAAVAFLIGLGLGAGLDGSLRPYAVAVAAGSAATSTVAWTLVRRLAR
jgi:MFS transporter, DHA1 family, multidrug resistance protein